MYLRQSIYLIEKVLQNHCITRLSYEKYLKENNYRYSKNTITRILNFIDETFGIKLKAKRSKQPELNCYYIDKEYSEPYFIQKYNTLKYFYINGLLSQNILGKQNLHTFFSISNGNVVNQGLHYLDEVLEAIITKRKIKINYQSFFYKNPKTYIIEPVLLREYLGRWYVIGNRKSELNKEQPVFALDRIAHFELTKDRFTETQDFINDYEATIGASLSGKVKKVVFEVNEQQHKYFQTLLFHSSQKHTIQNGKHIYTFRLRINYELKQWIKHYGKEIKVLKPKMLQKEIKAELKNMLENYK